MASNTPPQYPKRGRHQRIVSANSQRPFNTPSQPAVPMNYSHAVTSSPPHTTRPTSGMSQSLSADTGSQLHDGSVSDNVTSSTRLENSRRNRAVQHGSASPHHPRGNTNTSARRRQMSPHSVSDVGVGPATTATPTKSFYAGPTFHASPAASQLPIPRFSRPASKGSVEAATQDTAERASNSSASPSSISSTPATPEVAGAVRSPLDFLLNAHRDEQSRNQQARSLSGQFASSDSNLPRPGSLQPTPPSSSIRTSPRPFSIEPHNGQSFELRGSSGAASNASMFNATGSADPYTSSGRASDHYQQPRSQNLSGESLKELLFGGPKQASPLSTPPSTGTRESPHSPFSRPTSSPMSQHRQSPRTVSPQIAVEQPHTGNSSPGSLHYGNRNLSPLFQASKGQKDRRGSALRQELSTSPSIEHHPEPTSPTSPTPTRQTFSRDIPAPSLPNGSTPYSTSAPPSSHAQMNHHPPPSFQQPPHQNGQVSDISAMEQKLRQVLNIQSLSGSSSDIRH